MPKTLSMLSTSIVKPSSPTPPQHMFLSALDSFWRWFRYNQRILFFKSENRSPDFVISHLKASLASVLVEFFPWAGRAFEQEGRLALDCNDAGVPFIEAYIDIPFSSLEIDGFQYQALFKHFAPHGDVTKWTGPDLPLLSVQVTRFFQDGGFVLGIGHSHIVADGSSLWHFMKSWGPLCSKGGHGSTVSSSGNGHVIAATDTDKDKDCIFYVIANMRSKLEPPLPEAYFGNAIIRNGTVAKREEILQETMGETALRIQELIESIDDNFMRTFYGKCEVLPLLKVLDEAEFKMVMLQVSSSPRFPVYDVDFGWGPPLCVRSPHIRSNGEMVWFCGREGGGSIDVSIALLRPVMERLEQDESFLSF
ncbi:hypothetical protein L7F22_032762 [Adiantum nelumboides]|nr:hypothetical protein [Adiantum nelumboides]